MVPSSHYNQGGANRIPHFVKITNPRSCDKKTHRYHPCFHLPQRTRGDTRCVKKRTAFFPNFSASKPKDEKANKNVQHHRDCYKRLDAHPAKYPEIEQRAHECLKGLCKSDTTRNRTPDFTTQSLCYDCYRTVARIVENARNAGLGGLLKPFRFHVKKIKKLDFRISQNASCKSKDRKRRYKNDYDTIISRTEEAVKKAGDITRILTASGSEAALAFAVELVGYLGVMVKIVAVARRRFHGEKVPNEEKIFSLFEPHTELIQKGKKNKPIEFGHLIFLTQTREKFITDCILSERSPSETTLLPEVVERHEEQFGRKPLGVAMDKGCHPGMEEMEHLQYEYGEEVEYIGIPSRINDFGEEEMGWYQRFRAGIEGSISFLKRCFGLTRVFFKGFRGFCQGIGSAVFCHNLVTMVRRELASE